MHNKSIGLVGGSSHLGVTIARMLHENGDKVVAFSRQHIERVGSHVVWQQLDHRAAFSEQLNMWIYAAPIWTVSAHWDLFLSYDIRRIIVVSSTSRFTKIDASDRREQVVAAQLIAGELALQQWAEANNVEWVILRPTLMYGYGLDKNISEIVRVASRFRCFPLLGGACGLRQPIHVRDVASACVTVMKSAQIINTAYNLSGGEILSYDEMVRRVLMRMTLDLPKISILAPKIISVPLWLMKIGIKFLRCFPRYQHITIGMVERMNENLVFSHEDAARDFGFSPQPFSLQAEDLPRIS